MSGITIQSASRTRYISQASSGSWSVVDDRSRVGRDPQEEINHHLGRPPRSLADYTA